MRLDSSRGLGALLAAACLAGCADPTPHPPQLGNCTPDAACGAFSGGGVSGGGGGDSGRGDAAPFEDASDSSAELDDATACGQAGATFAAYPGCADCIASQGAGASCCGFSTTCSGDSECSTILQCALMCQGGGGSCLQGCATFTAPGVVNFNNLAQCIHGQCSSVCPPLPTVTVGDQ